MGSVKLRLPAVGIGSSSEEAGSKRQRQSSRAAKSTSQRRLSQGSQIGVVAAQPGAMRKVGRSAAEQTSPRSEQRLRLPPVCPSHTPEQPDGVSSASLSAGSYYSSSHAYRTVHSKLLDGDVGARLPDLARHLGVPPPAKNPLPCRDVRRHAQGVLHRELRLVLVRVVGAGGDARQRVLTPAQPAIRSAICRWQ